MARPGYPVIEPPKLFTIQQGSSHAVVEGAYVNNGPYAAAVVATIDYSHGEWAAYMGGVDADVDEEEAMLYVASHGIKLPKEVGCNWFPMLPPECWRV